MTFGIKWKTQNGMQSLGDFLTLRIAFRHSVSNAQNGSVAIPADLGLAVQNSFPLVEVKDEKVAPIVSFSGSSVSWQRRTDFQVSPSASFDIIMIRYR